MQIVILRADLPARSLLISSGIVRVFAEGLLMSRRIGQQPCRGDRCREGQLPAGEPRHRRHEQRDQDGGGRRPGKRPAAVTCRR